MNQIAEAIKEIFTFLREWNSADQRQKRYALRRLRRIEKAVDVAERIFFIVDDMISIAEQSGGLKNKEGQEFQKLESKYRALVNKFNQLD